MKEQDGNPKSQLSLSPQRVVAAQRKNAISECITQSDRKQGGNYWTGRLGQYPHGVLSAIKTWQTEIITVHKERDQDVMRL